MREITDSKPPIYDAPVVVVLSGGQDSTTVLHWCKEQFRTVHAITMDYGQRHASELQAARRIAEAAGVASHEIVTLKGLQGGSLTDLSAVVDSAEEGKIPNTFLPGRNLVFLTLALSMAIRVRKASDIQYSDPRHYIATGVCETDYSGYPDCRQSTMDHLRAAMEAGTDEKVGIVTPLMGLTKAQTVQLALDLGYDCWEAVGMSVTCYHGQRPGCGECPSCVLRANGFKEAGYVDPVFQRDSLGMVVGREVAL